MPMLRATVGSDQRGGGGLLKGGPSRAENSPQRGEAQERRELAED